MNPFKTPQQMLMEEAGLPHYGAGNLVQGLGKDLMQQFSGRIQEAIRKYVRATGKMPSKEEVAQLEQHIQSLTKPAPSTGPAPTQARIAAETPAANKLVDATGRPYSPIPDPATGALKYPEQMGGYHAKDKFGMGPANMAARKEVYSPQHENVFGEDPFLSVANVGRLPSGTYKKSMTPSTEELAQRELQAADTGVDDAMGGLSRVQATEGDVPTIRPSQIAETASGLEAPAMDKISTEILMGKHKDLVRQVEQDFRSRGIVPDEEDILNAVTSMINPMRHNYTGMNPIGQRPMPPRGRPSATAEAEMREWRDTARTSGLPETVVSEHPSEWPMKHKQDYLIDTEPGKRGPFAKDWAMGEYAMGGMINPRDMQAEMLVSGYADGKIVKKYRPTAGDFARSAAQGLSMGWADEGEAAVRAMMDKGSSYDQQLARIQGEQRQFKEAMPGTDLALNVAGGLPTMFIPGMGQMNAAKMAAMGAVYGAGEAQPGERLEGAAIGAPMGAAMGKGMEYMGKGANAAYQAARRRFMNPEAKIAEGVSGRPFDFRSGMKAPTSPERQQWIGQAHEAGVKAHMQNDPAYKAAVYASWLKNRPEIIQQSGAQNYDQLMKATYGQVAKETGEQFKAIPNKVRMYGPDEAQQRDYLSRASRLGKKPAEFMRERLGEGKPFNVFKDVDNPHPYLAERDPQTGMNQNEQFRAVHDYFGHLGTKKPNTFGPQGEENAWLAHRQMYSPLAEPAMTSETRGANSWVNYVDPENIARRKQGQHTVNYAENQPVLLPAEASDPAYAGGMPEYLQRIIK